MKVFIEVVYAGDICYFISTVITNLGGAKTMLVYIFDFMILKLKSLTPWMESIEGWSDFFGWKLCELWCTHSFVGNLVIEIN